MALPVTSGVANYTLTASRIIAGALRMCSAIADEETPDAAMAANAMESLNAMVMAWQASGIHVWCEEEAVLFLNPGQPRYALGLGATDHSCLFSDLAITTITATVSSTVITVASATGIAAADTIGIQLDAGTTFWTTVSGAPSGNNVTLADALPSGSSATNFVFAYPRALLRPLRAIGARRYNWQSQVQTPIGMMARLDYNSLPNLYNTGAVTQAFYDPQTGNGVYASSAPIGYMNVWPSPNDNTFGFRFVSQRPLQYFSTLANTPDFPAEWTAALRWNLASEIAPEYDVPAERMGVLKEKAAQWLARAMEWDKEPEPIRFGVSMSPGYR
jgi:hypothetical protein